MPGRRAPGDRREHGELQQAAPSSAGRRGYRDAHAASAQTSPDSRFAVAESDGVMLASGVTARAWYVRRRLAVRCCRHRVAFPQNPAQPCLLTTNPPSQPCRGRMGNSRSRMSPSPQPIASIDEPGYRPDGKSCRSCRAGTRSRIGPLDVQLSLVADSQCLERPLDSSWRDRRIILRSEIIAVCHRLEGVRHHRGTRRQALHLRRWRALLPRRQPRDG
jgi:hypothetical protein